MDAILKKYKMEGTISGDKVTVQPEGKPVKFGTELEKMLVELVEINPNVTIEIVPKGIRRTFVLSKNGWQYLQETGKFKAIKKKTVAVMIYKLRKKAKEQKIESTNVNASASAREA